MARDTARFFELLNQQNERIAARKAEEKAEEERRGSDQFRLQRDAEKREKWGQLRAREHPSKRPHRSRHVFGSSHLGQTPVPE